MPGATPHADFWAQDVTYLKKVGPKRAEALAEVFGIRTYDELLHHLPRRYSDRSQVTQIAELMSGAHLGTDITLQGEIHRLQEHRKGRRRWLSAVLADGSGYLQLQWFRSVAYIEKKFAEGDHVIVAGKPRSFRGMPSIAHPEIEHLSTANGQPSETAADVRIQPHYPSTEKLKHVGLDGRGFRELLWQLLSLGADKIDETLPPGLREAHNLASRREALTAIHFPATYDELARAQRRLKFEELFLFELILAEQRLASQPQHHAPSFHRVGRYLNRFYAERLPFELTGAQKRVIKEIRADLKQPHQMNRMLQGDVGSGKTLVAVMAILLAVDNGYQAALMAPTEILAEQHLHTLVDWLHPLGLSVEFLVGGQGRRERQSRLARVATGQAPVVVGTHALIEESVQFQNLGLTIIDEQHKFGVRQRARLWEKRPEGFPHNLAMTATPIPRTLAMTVYGDIDVSIIDELPPGRQPVITALRKPGQRLRVLGFLGEQIQAGRQAYVVYPLVEENAELELNAVEQGYESLVQRFGRKRVDIVHGKMPSADKERVMRRFKNGEFPILVSTTVIEVGVDVPNATLMIIENAERFGLSQLHQLRGRVGRGAAQSYCILMGPDKPNDNARARLEAMVQTTDGFRIAEVDLHLRGPGDFLGTRQSGLPDFRLADIVEDRELVKEAREAAFAIIRTDPGLRQSAQAGLRQQVLAFRKRQGLEHLGA